MNKTIDVKRFCWMVYFGLLTCIPTTAFARQLGTNAIINAAEQAGAAKPTAEPPAPGTIVSAPNDEPGPRLGDPLNFEYRVAAKIVARADTRQILVTLPIPEDWPEQSVIAVEEDVPPATTSVEVRKLKTSPRQIVAVLAALPSGESAVFSLTYDVQVRSILPPTNPEQYVIPAKLDKELKQWLDDSPGISSRDYRVRNLVKDVLGETDANDWQKIHLIREWIHTNVEPSNEDNDETFETIKKKAGTAENRTRLFVAMCRSQKIPARMVWSEGSDYAEFYLEHSSGQGYWFPCVLSPSVELGANPDPGVIQQKGDRFRVPEKKSEELNFVTGFISAKSTTQPAFGYVEGQVRK